jgi:PAS domain-containing protein
MDTSEQAIVEGTPKRETRRRRSFEEKQRIVEDDVTQRGVSSSGSTAACGERQPSFYWRKKYREGRLGKKTVQQASAGRVFGRHWNRSRDAERMFSRKPEAYRKHVAQERNDLRELLAGSVDAVVVTNVDRRFIAANPVALHLFGVSETNITQFTINAFLLEGEILHLDGNGLPFISREETRGECKIRRLTGDLRIADCIFVANVVPFWHLLIFRNVHEWVFRRRVAAAG